MPGSLFVVATPIGNLEDISLRALRTLREVDLVAAEDTRRTANLLAHYEIRRPVVSLREHNESRESPRLVARMTAGESIALVSDAGTPTVADPGTRLVAAAHAAGIQVIPIPGPSAVMAALSASGLPADKFHFLGFPPASGSERSAWFEDLAQSSGTVVFFEAPHRIRRTLEEVTIYLAERPTMVCRELTKINENVVEWDKSSIDERGEFVVVVGPPGNRTSSEPPPAYMSELFGQITDSTNLDSNTVVAMLAGQFGVSQVRMKNLIKKGTILRRRAADNHEVP